MWCRTRSILAAAAALVLLAASCGSDDATDASAQDQPTVVVSTNILGDVVENIAGDQVNVVTIMPVGADPHDFQASAQQVAQIGDCLLYTSPSPRDATLSRMPSSA